jgi:signal transduction histidine kinase
MKSRSIQAFVLALVAWLIAAGSGVAAAGDGEPAVRRVLVVLQDESTLEASMDIARGVRKALNDQGATKFEVYIEYLDIVRFPAPDNVRRLADYIVKKYENVPLDAVIALGPRAIQFMLEHRRRIAPGVPLVFGDVSERTLEQIRLPKDAWGIVTPYDVGKTVDLALRLQPEATRIVVVNGTAEFDRYWEESARLKLGDEYEDVPVDYLSGLTLNAFVVETAKLPADAILLVLTVFEDADGRRYRPLEAATEIAAASGAPAYGILSTYIGSGFVGGDTRRFVATGEEVAKLAAKLVLGDESLPQIRQGSSQPIVDWRQVRRWGIDVDRLPGNADLMYYEPSPWERYRWQIIAIAAALLAQSLAIGVLIYEHRRRRTAEQQARARLLENVHLSQSAVAGALSASIGHELNQPIGAILNNAEAAEILLRSATPDLDLIREIIVEIRDDDRRAGEIIARLRGMLRKRDAIEFQVFDLNEAVDSAIRVLRAETERRKVAIVSIAAPRPLPVRADRIHVQQVVINLATNAMDAMTDTAKDRQKLEMHTAAMASGRAEVSVADSGAGIPADRLGKVFDAFYTTKPNGTGLGLSISRALIEIYGGKIWVENRPEGGAVFRFELPLVDHG